MQLPDMSYASQLDNLASMKTQGTGMVSIMAPASMQIARLRAFISQEITSAENIKNPRNRKAVASTLGSIYQYTKVSTISANGVVIFADGENITRWLTPPTAVSRFSYNCGSSYDIESARKLLDVGGKYGYIVIDGHGALFAAVGANGYSHVLSCRDVDLPPKQGRGGQSQNRFARLRL